MEVFSRFFCSVLQGGYFSMANASPVTGIIEEQNVILDFGKYEGKSVSEVAEVDPDFYGKLVEQKDNFAIRRHKDKTFRLYINPLFSIDS
jgi:hypothetical protein